MPHYILAITHIFVGTLIIAMSIPLVRKKVSMNDWNGIRFQKSYSSSENWYKINCYGGKQLILWSVFLIVFGVATWFMPLQGNNVLTIVNSCAPVIFLMIPVFKSYWYAKNL